MKNIKIKNKKSSRCINADSNYAGFRVYDIIGGGGNSHGLCGSDSGENSIDCAFRPVITLNSNVQIDTANSGNGNTAEQGYAIK